MERRTRGDERALAHLDFAPRCNISHPLGSDRECGRTAVLALRCRTCEHVLLASRECTDAAAVRAERSGVRCSECLTLSATLPAFAEESAL